MDFQAILIILIGSVIFIAILFFPLRWLLLRTDERAKDSPRVSLADILKVVPVLVFFFTVAWYKEAGSSNAAVLMTVIMVGVSIAGLIVIAKAKKDDDV